MRGHCGQGLSAPRVTGGQLGNGAMGNARWTGVPLARLYPAAGELANGLLVTATETTSVEDIEALASALQEALA